MTGNSGVSQNSLNNLAALALAVSDMLPADFGYRTELQQLVSDALDGLDVAPGWADALVHDHRVQLDRVLTRKPGEYE